MLEGLHILLNRLCPESCPRCGFESEAGFCHACRSDFSRVVSPCPRCAMPGPCKTCPMAGPDWLVDSVRAPWIYTDPLAHYFRAMKFHGNRTLGRALGLLLAAEIQGAAVGIDALIAVPLHPARLRTRRFNQADEIAAPVARSLSQPLLSASVRRRINTRPQVELKRQDRMVGPLRSFSATRDFHGMRIAIVDDVITTGATVNALAGALKSAGAAGVEAWSVARSIGTSRNRN